MCAFLPSNIPLLCGVMFAPPTMFNTLLIQVLNQSYMAGLNYANRNPMSTFTNGDLAQGYGAAVTASVVVAFILRKATANITKSATGVKLMALNSMVGALSAASAAYCNTTLMR